MKMDEAQTRDVEEVVGLLAQARLLTRRLLLRTRTADRAAVALHVVVPLLDEALALAVLHGGLCAKHLGELVSIRLVKAGLGARMEQDCGEDHDHRAVN